MKQRRYIVLDDFVAYDLKGTSPADFEFVEFQLESGEIITDLNEIIQTAGIADGSLMAIDRLSKAVVVLDYDHANNLKEINHKETEIKITPAIEIERVNGMIGSTQYVIEGEKVTVELFDGRVIEGRFADIEQSMYEEESDKLLIFIDETNETLKISIDMIKEI